MKTSKERIEKSQEEFKDLVLTLLKSNEGLEATVKPLLKGQDYALKALESHQTTLLKLMKIVTGIDESQKGLKSEFEEIRQHIPDLGLYKELAGRIKRIENALASSVIRRIRLGTGERVTQAELMEFRTFVEEKGDADLFIILGDLYAQQKQYVKALKTFEKAIQIDSKNVHARCRKGLALRALGKHAEALRVFEKLKEPVACQPDFLYFRALCETALGANEKALNLVNLAIEGKANIARFWALKGRVLIDLNRDMEALGCLEKALEMSPRLTTALNDKGIALASLGPDYKMKALEFMDKAVAIQPKVPALWHNRGLLLAELDREEEAIKSYSIGIDLGSKNPCLYCHRGISKNHRGDNSGALEDFNKAFELGVRPKECGLFHQCKAIVLDQLKKYDEALKEVDKAIKIDPKDVGSWATRIGLLMKLDRREDAEKALEKISGLPPPTDADILNSLAYELYRFGDYSKGIDLAKKALEIQPNNVYFLDTLACLLSGLGRNMESLETFSRAIELKKHDRQITWKELANVYEKLGKLDKAKRTKAEHREDM
jgi:tetratricopeptide (TPR) repeat protein